MNRTITHRVFLVFLTLMLIITMPVMVWGSGSGPSPKITFKNESSKRLYIIAGNCHASYYTKDGGVPTGLSAGDSFSDDYAGCFDVEFQVRSNSRCERPRFSSSHATGSFRIYGNQCTDGPFKDYWMDISYSTSGSNATIVIKAVSDKAGF